MLKGRKGRGLELSIFSDAHAVDGRSSADSSSSVVQHSVLLTVAPLARPAMRVKGTLPCALTSSKTLFQRGCTKVQTFVVGCALHVSIRLLALSTSTDLHCGGMEVTLASKGRREAEGERR